MKITTQQTYTHGGTDKINKKIAVLIISGIILSIVALKFFANPYAWIFLYFLFVFIFKTVTVKKSMKKSAVLDPVDEALTRYFESEERSNELVCRNPGEFEVDGRLEHVNNMLSRPELHNEDYKIFRAFTDKSETILDIGANWGSSVGSIWASGASCNILSFEPLLLYRDCLELIRTSRQGKYDFRIVGLGAWPDIVQFVTPVINGVALTSFTSADPAIHKNGLLQNIRAHIERETNGGDDTTIRLYEFQGDIVPLDDVMRRETFSIPVNQIVAMKIDVEGFERQVLEGAIEIIKMHKPLIMVETGNRTPGVSEMMSNLGYFYAERNGDKLVRISGVTDALNGFYVYRDNEAKYVASGILKDHRVC